MSILTRALKLNRTAAKAVRTARLGLDSFDERCLPSVTTNLAPSGVLAITGDAANDEVVLMNGQYPQVMTVGNTVTVVMVPSIRVESRSNGWGNFTAVANVPKSQISSVTFNGGAGNDTFNATLISGTAFSSIDGGSGDDTLFGSMGNDVFVGSPGNDRYIGFFGNDQLHRNGNRGYFLDNGIGDDVTTGLVTGTLSYAELTAPGTKLFARPNPTDATRLQIYGPSGAGFEIKADSWIVTDMPSAGATQYKATGSVVKIDTTRGLMSLPAAAFQNVRIGYSTGGATHKAGPVTNLSLDLTTALGGVVDEIESKTGMSVTLPNLGGGIALGANLGHLDLPVAPAVPYLYAALSPTIGASVGDLSPSIPTPGSGWGVAIAVDPTDIGGMIKLSTPFAEVGFGWSQNGEIPYMPTYTPDDRGNPMIAGNLYISGSGSLTAVPVSLTGEMVLDLDANNDGAWAGLTPDRIGKIARGKDGFGAIVGAINDIKIGFNGEVDASLPISKTVDLELPLGRGSLYWSPGQNGQPGEAAFRAKSANPFEDTPFETFFAGNGFDFQGRFATNGDFRLAATSTAYSVDLDLGGISLGSMHQSFGVDFRKDGSVVSLAASYHFDMTIGDMSFLGASIAIDANLRFAVNTASGAISVSGSGSVAADVCLFGIDMGTTFGVAFDNHGVYVDMPGGDALDFNIKW